MKKLPAVLIIVAAIVFGLTQCSLLGTISVKYEVTHSAGGSMTITYENGDIDFVEESVTTTDWSHEFEVTRTAKAFIVYVKAVNTQGSGTVTVKILVDDVEEESDTATIPDWTATVACIVD